MGRPRRETDEVEQQAVGRGVAAEVLFDPQCVDDHLPRGVVPVYRFLRVNGYVLEEAQHRRDPLWMDPVLRFLQADQPATLGVLFEDGQSQKTQGPIRQGHRRVRRAVPIPYVQCEQLSLVVLVHPDAPHVVDEFRESIGDFGMDSGSGRIRPGPARFALRRLPVRRDFYPSPDPGQHARYEAHARFTVDPLGDPRVNPYALAQRFTYRRRWTSRHFSVHRDLIRAMCLDAGEELRAAWEAILRHGGPEAQPEAVTQLQRLPDRPEPLTWRTALSIPKTWDRMEYMREWTLFFRDSYREAKRLAEEGAGS